MLDALPLDDIPAVKVYLGLPLFGQRAVPGGGKELALRQKQDFGLLVFKPAVLGAGDELPLVVAALKERGCLAPGASIGLVGFSAGGAAALYAMSQAKVAIGTVVLINASTGLSASVQALEQATGQKYLWSPESRAIAEKTGVARYAAGIARVGTPPALLLVQGADDSVIAPKAASDLYEGLLPYYRKAGSERRIQFVRLAGMPHQWSADEHALDSVRQALTKWFQGSS
ncbi:hypothetical protein DVJ77_08720 [Dyella tabacisoli]|uniref:Peptidase S9 prolyl oligopeptidase catalytic domain-containing protein n=2 Tax=Dyella tabacisoli TaxID=2282381 RepID=A0A369UMY5_9GAMM|nr:hypothetical protein DVJ77_08720 [Dyella tabacisoli]